MAENHLLRATTTLAASTGTLLVLWGSNGDALLIIGACLVGLPEGFLLYLSRQPSYSSSVTRRRTSSCLFSWALLIAAALYLTVAFLGTAAGYICAALPLLSLAGLATDAHKRSAQNTEGSDAETARTRLSFWGAGQKLPWKLLLGLAVFGIAFGLMRISASSESVEVFQESYLAHTLARAGTTVVALVPIGKLKRPIGC
ncbi:MAG: hypothetical protein ACLTSX_13615 [Collinsella sp.]